MAVNPEYYDDEDTGAEVGKNNKKLEKSSHC
jgi:hypothetical protein